MNASARVPQCRCTALSPDCTGPIASKAWMSGLKFGIPFTAALTRISPPPDYVLVVDFVPTVRGAVPSATNNCRPDLTTGRA
jgi:hypothetical protein